MVAAPAARRAPGRRLRRRVAVAVRAGGEPRNGRPRFISPHQLPGGSPELPSCRMTGCSPAVTGRCTSTPAQPADRGSARFTLQGRPGRLAARSGVPAPGPFSERTTMDAYAGGGWRSTYASVARRNHRRAAPHRRARGRVRLEPGGACGGPCAFGELVAEARASLRERRRLWPPVQQRMVAAGCAPLVWCTDRLRRPECLPGVGERVPRPGADARVPCTRACTRVPRPRACTGVPCPRAVVQPASAFVCASFQRRFQPLRVIGRRSQPRRRLGRRPLRRVRRRWAAPLTAVDALSPPRYQGIARAFNSAEECHLHTVEAVGSIPTTPTQHFNYLGETSPSPKPVRDEFRDEFSARSSGRWIPWSAIGARVFRRGTEWGRAA